jgi:hypothetical protein
LPHQGSSSSDVIKLPVAQQPYLIGNGPTTFGTNPYFDITVLGRAGPGITQGPKGMALVSVGQEFGGGVDSVRTQECALSSTRHATSFIPAGMLQDDNGFVYVTSNTGGVSARNPSSLAQLFSSSLGLSLQALSFKLLQGVRLLYACASNNAAISKLQINYILGQSVLFAPAAAISINAPGGCRGVVVEDDGTVFYTGVASNSATADATHHFVAKVHYEKGLRADIGEHSFTA